MSATSRARRPEGWEPARPGSVYVHAPFCARRCPYCDFAVHVRSEGGAPEWLEAIAGELEGLGHRREANLPDRLDTLYVGGGTPSLLGPEAMDGLARVLGRGRLEGPALEWTAEANPESFTPEVARAWSRAGVNRVSLGVQSFHEPTLRWMGRLHGREGAARAVAAAREAGVSNVSVDLIFGLPGGRGRSWSADVERALSLDVPHVSLYGLTVEEGTPLARAVREGRERFPEVERYREEFLRAAEVLAAEGYEHYEVSNFARPGHRSAHNAAYWDGRPYLGLGNGAHSFASPVRRWNVREWPAYHAAARAGRLVEEGREELDGEALRLERIWLSLRTADGWTMPRSAPGATTELVGRWRRDGLAIVVGDRLRLTPEGWLFLDRLALDLEDTLPAEAGAGGHRRPGALSGTPSGSGRRPSRASVAGPGRRPAG